MPERSADRLQRGSKVRVTKVLGDLGGKVALITGASKGIGEGIALGCLKAGAAVMISSRKVAALDAAAARLRASVPGAMVMTFAANAGDPEQADACVMATIEQLGSLDLLVNNAATNPHFGPLVNIELSAWDKIGQVNLRGPVAWVQSAWRRWMHEHGGSILNISSVGGLRHGEGLGAYDVSKAGLNHLTRVLAAELAPNVRVNTIAPGFIETDFSRVLLETLDVEKEIPLGRIGRTEDIANAAVFLMSPAASWITGITLIVDGGAFVKP